MRGYKMIMAAAATVTFLGGGFTIGTSGALASWSSTSCEADGGTYTKDGPDSTCTYPETTKDVSGNAFGTATQDTTTGRGNLGNDPEATCTGNPGQCKQ
jgi:hypothetical protein